jgi:hypothetical protein
MAFAGAEREGGASFTCLLSGGFVERGGEERDEEEEGFVAFVFCCLLLRLVPNRVLICWRGSGRGGGGR